MCTRHNCTACRLAKCFMVGMNSDLIRKEDHKKIKTSSSTKSDNTEQVQSQQITVRYRIIKFLSDFYLDCIITNNIGSYSR
jgi:hypothetical protein